MNARKRTAIGLTLGMLATIVLSACGPTPEPQVTAETVPTQEPTPVAAICANVWTPYYSSRKNYLGVLDSASCANAFGLIIDFVEPVDSVSLSFSGASVPYILQVYDENGTQVSSQVQEAEFNNGDGTLFEIGYASNLANIERVLFSGPSGGNRVVIAVREIAFSRTEAESRHNFDTFPDGTVIASDTQDAEGRQWRSLTGDEFADWGFLVSTY
jgi:hypothetical protein